MIRVTNSAQNMAGLENAWAGDEGLTDFQNATLRAQGRSELNRSFWNNWNAGRRSGAPGMSSTGGQNQGNSHMFNSQGAYLGPNSAIQAGTGQVLGANPGESMPPRTNNPEPGPTVPRQVPGMPQGSTTQPVIRSGQLNTAVQPGITAWGGNPATAAAIANNPDRLEEYWRNNPGTLQNAMNRNPGAFTGFGSGGGLSTGGAVNNQFSSGGLSQNTGGDYNPYINEAFSHAMRTMDPYIEQQQERFDQTMIDRGFARGSEGYTKAFDDASRSYNDLLNSATFNAMNFGAGRMDADRQYGLNRDIFDLNELSTIDGMNRAWDGIGFRNAQFNTARDDQRFNQMMSLFGFTPVGSTTPFNANAAFGNSANAQINALNANNALWGSVGEGIGNTVSQIPWDQIFGNRTDSPVP